MQTKNKDLARAMRHELTWAEKLLWRQLRNRKLEGMKFRRQQPLGSYILDFYCSEKMLAVELDGGQHDIPEEREYDLRRTDFLKSEGVDVLRVWNSQIRENLPWVLELVRRKAGVSTAPSPFPPQADPPVADRGESSSPSPFRGEGWGEGGHNPENTPHPSPLPQGEREQRETPHLNPLPLVQIRPWRTGKPPTSRMRDYVEPGRKDGIQLLPLPSGERVGVRVSSFSP